MIELPDKVWRRFWLNRGLSETVSKLTKDLSDEEIEHLRSHVEQSVSKAVEDYDTFKGGS